MLQASGNFQLWGMMISRILALVCVASISLNHSALSQEDHQQAESAATSFKTATVDIQALFRDYHKTQIAQREINVARAEIQKKSQLSTNEIQERRRKLLSMEASLNSGELDEAQVRSIQTEGPILLRELRMMEEQKQKEYDLANQNLNQQMVRRMSGILEEITILTQKYADESGFDLVVDRSGKNSSQVIPILFIKGAEDITPLMKKELSKSSSGSR